MRNAFALIPLLILVAQLAAKPEAWPVFPFQNGVHFKTTAERVKVLKELGYDGIGSAKLSKSELPRGSSLLESLACLLYTSPSPRDATLSRMPSSA